jgi:hypothetical protein
MRATHATVPPRGRPQSPHPSGHLRLADRTPRHSAIALKRGIVRAATIVDHVEPHRGDWNQFVLGKLQSLLTLKEVDRYTRMADRARNADRAMQGRTEPEVSHHGLGVTL